MADSPASLRSAVDAASKPVLPRAINAGDVTRVKQAAQEYEAVFISQMIQPMFEGIKTTGKFGGGQAESIYRTMMVSEYGKAMAARGGLGLAHSLTQGILKTQEVP